MSEINSSFEHRGIALVMTCGACPEQYDAFDGRGRQVGYFRLRHGYFSVEHPDVGGVEVYSAQPEGDGIFTTAERDGFLRAGIDAIKQELARHD